jgi:hypothetical protein
LERVSALVLCFVITMGEHHGRSSREYDDSRRKRDRYSPSRSRRRYHDSSDSDSGERKRHGEKSKRMVKKIERHLKKHSRSHASGYRDEENPFGDTNLSQRFVWGKKIERDLEAGASIKEYSASAHSRRDQERMNEIEKVKRKREEREAERAAIAEELELLQRERARAEAVELEKQEDLFHLEQAKIRAQQRLSAGRPKAIDIITNNLFLLDGFDKTAEDPNVFISGLTLFQLQELTDDIQEYSRLDAVNIDHADFWEALETVSRHALVEAKRQDMIDKATAAGMEHEQHVPREAGWHPSLESDIAGMLEGKSVHELESLERSIIDQLEYGDAPDPDYWQSVLRRLNLYKAKARLREFHENVVEKELEKIRQGFDVPTATMTNAERAAQAKEEARRSEAAQQIEDATRKEEQNHPVDDTVPTAHDEKEAEPKQQSATFADELYKKAASSGPEVAAKEESGSLMKYMSKSATTSGNLENRKLKAIAAQTMGQDVEGDASSEFVTEVNLSSRTYPWSKTYEPRKPKYFNKVHTTFFWTKYNKVHYDRDNPPPKVVSGYKFNIFYPDLIDPSKTPKYSIEKDEESADGSTCILKFSAGAPYEDVAFRIINKKWNTDSRGGFRCVFDRGILQLYFRFMMQFYKR